MKKDLSKLKKTELLELAHKKKLQNVSTLRKAELIALLEKNTLAPASKDKTLSKIKKVVKKTAAKRPAKKQLKARVASLAKTMENIAIKKMAEKVKKKINVKSSTVTAKKVSKQTVNTAILSHQKQNVQHDHEAAFHHTTNHITEELPVTYGTTELIVMARDPYWAFSYWDFASDTTEYIKNLYHEHHGLCPVLRIYDVSGISFNGKNAHRCWDLDVALEAKSWYINFASPGASFVVDLGMKDNNGKFFLLARSNTIVLPLDYPSDVVDEQWMISDIDFEELYAISGGATGIGLSSAEHREKKKRSFHLEQALSSGALSSGALASHDVVKKGGAKDFFLEAATELILYGRTKPDAKLTVDNKLVKLRQDGTFTLRYFLPDGSLRLPVKAVSVDGDDTREIKIKVTKETK